MKLKRGDILACAPEAGCGLKVVVIQADEGADCDVRCCGNEMTPAQKEGEEMWKQYVKECGPEDWKKFAEGGKQE